MVATTPAAPDRAAARRWERSSTRLAIAATSVVSADSEAVTSSAAESTDAARASVRASMAVRSDRLVAAVLYSVGPSVVVRADDVEAGAPPAAVDAGRCSKCATSVRAEITPGESLGGGDSTTYRIFLTAHDADAVVDEDGLAAVGEGAPKGLKGGGAPGAALVIGREKVVNRRRSRWEVRPKQRLPDARCAEHGRARIATKRHRECALDMQERHQSAAAQFNVLKVLIQFM